MHNVRYGTDLDPFDRARTAVLGFVGGDGTPRSCAVTPYVVDGRLVVSSTLAYLAKVRAISARPAAALYVDGAHASADAAVEVHRASTWFDAHLRDQELAKYPPARTLLALPFHRKLLWWYVGRAAVTFTDPVLEHAVGSDRATITTLADGRPRVRPLASVDPDGDVIDVGDVADGPASVLVHDEDDDMTELRQLVLRGSVTDGRFHVVRRSGTLEPTDAGTWDQVRSLRALARAARANRQELEHWDRGATDA